MAKKNFFAVVATILALCAAVSFSSCSGSDLDGSSRETSISEEVSTSVDNTFVEHNWEEKENSFHIYIRSLSRLTTRYGLYKENKKIIWRQWKWSSRTLSLSRSYWSKTYRDDENKILIDTNYITIKGTPEYNTNLDINTPTNRIYRKHKEFHGTRPTQRFKNPSCAK